MNIGHEAALRVGKLIETFCNVGCCAETLIVNPTTAISNAKMSRLDIDSPLSNTVMLGETYHEMLPNSAARAIITRIKSMKIRFSRLLITVSLVGIAGVTTRAQRNDQPVVRVTPEQVQWMEEPNALGFQRAVIEGDPTKPGVYVVRVKFPPWVMSSNHFHREDRYAVVLKGTWYTGSGDEFAPDKTVPLKSGSYMK